MVPDNFKYAGYCHCSECRRFSGSIFSAFGGIPKTNFKILAGEELISHFQKSENTVLASCQKCGSSLYADKLKTGMLHIRLGALNEAPGLKPQAHVFTGSKVSWYEINDGLPQFEAAPPVR